LASTSLNLHQSHELRQPAQTLEGDNNSEDKQSSAENSGLRYRLSYWRFSKRNFTSDFCTFSTSSLARFKDSTL
jgi:hypothetical protein